MISSNLFVRHNEDMGTKFTRQSAKYSASSAATTTSPLASATSSSSHHFTVKPTGSDLDDTTRRAVSAMEKANSAIDAQHAKVRADSDTLSDKALRSAVPAIAGMIGSKGLESVWKKVTGSDHVPGATSHDNLLLSMLFSAVSAALGVLISRVAVSSVSAFVRHRHHRSR